MEALKENNLTVIKQDQNVSMVTGYQSNLQAGQIAQIKSCVSFERGCERPLRPEEIQKIWYIIQVRRLDPDTRQIYFICDKNGKINVFNSIDGLRLTAQRSGVYAGQEGPYFCGQDGVWKDVWLSPERPLASKVGVLRKGFEKPVWGIALFSEYGKQFGPWKQYPTVMLAKVAESLALRKAFPEELSGIYSEEEQWIATDKEDKTKEQENEQQGPKKIEAEVINTKTDRLVKEAQFYWNKTMSISSETGLHLAKYYMGTIKNINKMEEDNLINFINDLKYLSECKTHDEYMKIINYWEECNQEETSFNDVEW